MNKIITISAKTSKKTTPITAPKELFGEKENPTLLTQALHVYRARSHVGQVLKQTRSEVSRTKSKWYKQKGTGKARHGARTPNIFVGGGLAHGPDGLKRVLTLPKAIRSLRSFIHFIHKKNQRSTKTSRHNFKGKQKIHNSSFEKIS